MKNILFITADDLNCNSVGAWGCPVNATPNIDRLAGEGIRFNHSHVTVAVCQPSRGALMTGRYPHHDSVEGFYHIGPDIPTMPGCLKDAGFYCAILGKYDHSTPCLDFAWDYMRDMPDLGMGRDPEAYYREAAAVFAEAKKSDRDFYLMANSHDPHRPFYGSEQEREVWPDKWQGLTVPSKVFTPQEVEVPGFLPDIPEVRKEVAEYFSSVRRLDDTVGRILQALDESGLAEQTMVVFLSDNGMAFPYAKTNCYLHSTRTPWIVRLPGITSPATVDSEHFINGIDFMPTVLEWVDVECPDGVDGKSFLPLLHGEKQQGREEIYTQFHETAGKRRFPMRCIQNKQYGYIWNGWSDGERAFKNESQSGRTWSAMCRAGESSPEIQQRVDFFSHRCAEELYDFQNDPDALENLIDSPQYQQVAAQMRKSMAAWMKDNADPAYKAFISRDNSCITEEFMREQQARAGGPAAK